MSDVSHPPRADLSPDELLSEMRVAIDRIDAGLHALLLERSNVIDKLIAIKARQGGGSAFRPQREADMMRRIARRHQGLLPLDTVEGIWRIIISTFTYVQANYAVHADVETAAPAVRDSARFHFGFTVPFVPHEGVAGVLAAVAASSGDLGLLRAEATGAWWTPLAAPDAPKIIARVPFIARADHPAGLPLYVVARPLAEAAAEDVVLRTVSVTCDRQDAAGRLSKAGGTLVAAAPHGDRLSVLVAAPGAVAADGIAAALADGGPRPSLTRVGSHASPYDVASPPAAA